MLKKQSRTPVWYVTPHMEIMNLLLNRYFIFSTTIIINIAFYLFKTTWQITLRVLLGNSVTGNSRWLWPDSGKRGWWLLVNDWAATSEVSPTTIPDIFTNTLVNIAPHPPWRFLHPSCTSCMFFPIQLARVSVAVSSYTPPSGLERECLYRFSHQL